MEFPDLLNKDVYTITYSLGDMLSQTANNFSYIFTAAHAIEIIAVVEKHRDPASAATTLDVVIVPNGSIISSGTSVLKTPFVLNSTADTAVLKAGKDLTLTNTRIVKPYQSIALVNSADNASLTSVSVTIYYKPANQGSYRKVV